MKTKPVKPIADVIPPRLLTPQEADRIKAELSFDGAISIKEAVQFTGISRTTLYKLMENGKLPYGCIGRRRLLHRNALRELLASNTVLRYQNSITE